MPQPSAGCLRGFTLIELMIVLVIIGILAAIAYPSYVNYITNSRRAAAEACLANYADYMARLYATNLSYTLTPAQFTAAAPNCADTQSTGTNYQYSLASNSSTAYKIEAAPIATQLARDTACGILSVDQTGTRTKSGPASADRCWGQ